jgi:Flp pilus assembly pilin Flp
MRRPARTRRGAAALEAAIVAGAVVLALLAAPAVPARLRAGVEALLGAVTRSVSVALP